MPAVRAWEGRPPATLLGSPPLYRRGGSLGSPGLLVERVEPAATAPDVERADPDGAGHGVAVARRVLGRVIGEERRIRVQHRQFELVDLVAFHAAHRTGDTGDDRGLVGRPAEADLDVIVGEKILEELAVAVLPGLPGLFFQLDQVLFDRSLVAVLSLCQQTSD